MTKGVCVKPGCGSFECRQAPHARESPLYLSRNTEACFLRRNRRTHSTYLRPLQTLIPSSRRCILRWDNSFSRLRGKRLCFVFESATVQTMRAAIEAAGATDHKRRATRSTAAQTILDSGHGEVRVSVTAVGAADGFDADEEEKKQGENGSDRGGSGSPGSAIGSGAGYYSGGHYRFGRVRRVVADLLRDLGGIVDARKTDDASASGGGGGGGEGFSDGAVGVGDVSTRGAGIYGNVDAEGVERLVKQFELLEDELASVSARRAQSEAQAKVLLATLQKANTRADRCAERLFDRVHTFYVHNSSTVVYIIGAVLASRTVWGRIALMLCSWHLEGGGSTTGVPKRYGAVYIACFRVGLRVDG